MTNDAVCRHFYFLLIAHSRDERAHTINLFVSLRLFLRLRLRLFVCLSLCIVAVDPQWLTASCGGWTKKVIKPFCLKPGQKHGPNNRPNSISSKQLKKLKFVWLQKENKKQSNYQLIKINNLTLKIQMQTIQSIYKQIKDFNLKYGNPKM